MCVARRESVSEVARQTASVVWDLRTIGSFPVVSRGLWVQVREKAFCFNLTTATVSAL